MTTYNAYRDNLLDRPSMADGDRCAVCGRYAHDRHHVIPKGMGGVPKALEARIPKLLLCGNGNLTGPLGGCHGMAHQGLLHLNYTEAMGWCYLVTDDPMDDELAWRTRAREYRPVPCQRMTGTRAFGARG